MPHHYDLVLYHANCADGFTAAWLAHSYLGDSAEYLPMAYNDKPPMGDVAGKHVLVLDFSFKRSVLTEMGRHAKSITILDHHKTAKEDLAQFMVGIDGVVNLDDPQYFADSLKLLGDDEEDALPIRAWFDMGRSGAGLMLSYLTHLRPKDMDGYWLEGATELVRYVQDRDLWKFDLGHSRAVHAGLMSYPFEFDAWDGATEHLSSVIEEGYAILRAHDKAIAELLPLTQRQMVIGGWQGVPVANMPYTMASDAANAMAGEEGTKFAATYYDNRLGERVFSLRSSKEHGIDVGEIAKRYGGGGHKHAAGFTAPRGWEGDDTDHPDNWAPDLED